ncbi:MAG: leucine-rich repeat domain-containing protein [Treponema sp.]|jgi:hypothetical protein|nr:leucine-rich repeat domain-containing protein [Treponema sp.]
MTAETPRSFGGDTVIESAKGGGPDCGGISAVSVYLILKFKLELNDFVIKVSYETLKIVGGTLKPQRNFFMNKKLFSLVMLVTLLALSLVFASCSGSGGSSGGKAAPVTDFEYELVEDTPENGGDYIRITKYTGNGGKVVIPGKIEGYEVGEIGNLAFMGTMNSSVTGTAGGQGDNITEVVIPWEVFWIGSGAFQYCNQLTTVTIKRDYVVLGLSAFLQCENLTTLNIPDKNENPDIGTNVLTPLKKGDPLGGINAFYGCKKFPLKMRARLKEMGFTEL